MISVEAFSYMGTMILETGSKLYVEKRACHSRRRWKPYARIWKHPVHHRSLNRHRDRPLPPRYDDAISTLLKREINGATRTRIKVRLAFLFVCEEDINHVLKITRYQLRANTHGARFRECFVATARWCPVSEAKQMHWSHVHEKYDGGIGEKRIFSSWPT